MNNGSINTTQQLCYTDVVDVTQHFELWSVFAAVALCGGLALLRFGYSMFRGTACLTTFFVAVTLSYMVVVAYVASFYTQAAICVPIAVVCGCIVAAWMKPAIFFMGACGGLMVVLKASEFLGHPAWWVCLTFALAGGIASLKFVKPMAIVMTSVSGAVLCVFGMQILCALAGTRFCDPYEVGVTAAVAGAGMLVQGMLPGRHHVADHEGGDDFHLMNN